MTLCKNASHKTGNWLICEFMLFHGRMIPRPDHVILFLNSATGISVELS